MTTEALRELIKDYQLGLRDDISFLESFFPYSWCFVDEDGYELTLLYGEGFFAVYYHNRKLKHLAVSFLSEINPLKDLMKYVFGLEEQFGISFQEYYSRILAEFWVVGEMEN